MCMLPVFTYLCVCECEPRQSEAQGTLSRTIKILFHSIICNVFCKYFIHVLNDHRVGCNSVSVCVLTERVLAGAEGLVSDTISWMARRSLRRCRGLLMPISLWISVSDSADMMAPLFTLARHAATYQAGIPNHSWRTQRRGWRVRGHSWLVFMEQGDFIPPKLDKIYIF